MIKSLKPLETIWRNMRHASSISCVDTSEACLKQNNFSYGDIEGASIQHPCQLLFTISPTPILNSSIRSCALPSCAFKPAGAGKHDVQ